MQSVTSRACVLLTFQPITDADALKLDRFVATKVHAISGFPWSYNTDTATLPVSLHGFDFPSIHHIIASIAVDGLARNLNHHISAYHNMALITLADWTCHLNNCVNPLTRPGILKDFSQCLHSHTVLAAWIIAQKQMGAMKPPLRLPATDYSHILNGEVSISHSLKILKSYDNTCPSGSAAYSLRTAGIKLVNQIGKWFVVNHIFKFLPYPIDDRIPHHKTPTTAARINWNNITSALSQSNILFFFHSTIDLLIPRLQRQYEAEKHLHAHANMYPPPSPITTCRGLLMVP